MNKITNKPIETISEFLIYCYANLGMARVAVENNRLKYSRVDYMIRTKLYKGLISGKLHISSIYNDEKYKLSNVRCCYCGKQDDLSLDHLIPRYMGGADDSGNLVYACRSCNSSKSKKDLVEWCISRSEFPPLMTLQRYLKLACQYFEQNELLEQPVENLKNCEVFKLYLIPTKFPQPEFLKL